MRLQRTLVGLVLFLPAAGTAFAQADARLRWRAGGNPLGLQAAPATLALPCGNFTFTCGDAAALPLYLHSSPGWPRSLSMQIGYADVASLRSPGPQGPNVSLVGRAGIAPDLGVYGRVGTTFNRSLPPLSAMVPSESGLTYGVGFSWDFSRRASAALGWDSYDLRSTAGDIRDVRTSLGLQWRY
jgi:hypothetical protein